MYDKAYIRRGKMGHIFDSAARRGISQARLNNSECPILPCRISVYCCRIQCYLLFSFGE